MPLRTFVLSAALAAATVLPVQAQDAGGYLAARTAIIGSDFAEAAQYFSRALARDPGNPTLLENAVTAYVGLGDMERAVPVARRLIQTGTNSQLAGLVLFADAARTGKWDTIQSDIDAGLTVGPLFDGLTRAWSLVGEGRMSEALAAFDDVGANQGVEAFGLYHKALALASVGDFEGAAEIFSGESGNTIRLTTRGLVAYAEVLSQLERNADAIELIAATFGTNLDPFLEDVKARLEAGETLAFETVRTPEDGLAEVYFSIASALQGEAQETYTLLYSRMATVLRPDHIDALLMSAELLEALERYDLATEVYDTVPRGDPSFHAAELGRAEALRRSGREDAAIEVLRQLTKSHGDLPLIHVTLADTLRGLEEFEASIKPYNDALALIDEPDEQHWIIFFARGISHERTDQWEKAEADFRRALELQPEQPQVMNYLGYSFLEMQTNLDEALDLIERAVALRPDSGFIIDSLGWGLYRLGRYQEAVAHMEKAVELMPIDPVVNDHLGDVYWAVGRGREAEFQWHRALSFIDHEDASGDIDPDRVRRKLEVGLDIVLQEEGAPPLRVANDDG
ncbi:MAG: tetratricopeptide repeat protein [Boseongicola sp.]|nr:tetratricopeptide repeat protein [Silicimonas sp.]NND41588.1 tetratricopeptide repeat protein [Silicimonas sp.]NNF90482.1 tetratricopeptide repeat protein [Boseongicola sp.]RZW11772.1 MAG: tetratricopeptide repeat protein [Paracoccaceae bacterium]